MEKIIIQEQISITQKEVNGTILHYKSLPDTFRLGILGKVLNKEGIIKEINELSEIGKAILLMHHTYKKYEESHQS